MSDSAEEEEQQKRDPGEKEGQVTTAFCNTVPSGGIQHIFDLPHKDIHERGLPKLLQKVAGRIDCSDSVQILHSSILVIAASDGLEVGVSEVDLGSIVADHL
ncbi:hypothetical protein H920_16164 [Fukomys damarensis]|uniref:Uncharacterized protein n=1 Tax=Fukomys damarensis TaxID=885580 RepID=A0A091CWC3_FUKDA|nr:hypothetical protein H920_16164 [Fukomys damarensis]